MDIWQQSHLILSARAVTAVARSWLFPTLDLLKCSGTFVLVTVEESYVQVSKQTAALSTAYLSLLSWWLLKGLVRLHGIFIRLYRHGRGLSPGFFFLGQNLSRQINVALWWQKPAPTERVVCCFLLSVGRVPLLTTNITLLLLISLNQQLIKCILFDLAELVVFFSWLQFSSALHGAFSTILAFWF